MVKLARLLLSISFVFRPTLASLKLARNAAVACGAVGATALASIEEALSWLECAEGASGGEAEASSGEGGPAPAVE